MISEPIQKEAITILNAYARKKFQNTLNGQNCMEKIIQQQWLDMSFSS